MDPSWGIIGFPQASAKVKELRNRKAGSLVRGWLVGEGFELVEFLVASFFGVGGGGGG